MAGRRSSDCDPSLFLESGLFSVFLFVVFCKEMDFIPGNDYSEWQGLGDEDRSVLYQQVTVQEPMGWSGLSLDCYRAACGKFSGRILLSVPFSNDLGPIALKWNSDETLPMNCDIELTTDILIYDSCGKKVGEEIAVLRVDRADPWERLAVHTRGSNGMDVHGEVVHSLRGWEVRCVFQHRRDSITEQDLYRVSVRYRFQREQQR